MNDMESWPEKKQRKWAKNTIAGLRKIAKEFPAIKEEFDTECLGLGPCKNPDSNDGGSKTE